MTWSLPLFLLAVLLLFAAHVLRSHRHTLLFPDHLLPWRFDLLLGLSLSHLVNVLLPFRAGDAVRIGFVAMRYRLRSSYVAATVVTERLSDVCAVLAIAGALLAAGWGPVVALRRLALLLAGLAVVLITLAWAVRRSLRVRRATWTVLSIFSDRLRLWAVDLLWSLSQLVMGRALLRPEFLVLTVAMWALYLGSYAVFAVAANASLVEVGLVLIGGPERSLLQQLVAGGIGAGGGIGPQALLLLAFTALPVVAVLGYGTQRRNGQFMTQVKLMRRYGFQALAIAQPIAGDRFTSREDYGAFLQAHFTGSNAVVSKFGLIAASDVKVLRLLPGGSDAVTAMIETGGVIRIRKCATDGAAAKLAEQARWLREHGAALPLTRVVDETRTPAAYTYDMPYLLSARDFYEVIHTSPVARSARVLTEVVDAVDAFHRRADRATAPDAAIDKYLADKVCANARQVHAFAQVAFPGGTYSVNGVAHRLEEWNVLFDLDWLRAQVKSRETAVIHGDLTIENIIVSSEVERGWYLIDPNPANVFDTPLIDWAKLMQSLHLGYEGLNRGGRSVVRGSEVELMFLRSSAYSALHAHLSQHLERRLGATTMREIAFHELVNYLRLTPYKIRHAPEKALTFFACTSVLLRRYLDPATADHQPVRSLPGEGVAEPLASLVAP